MPITMIPSISGGANLTTAGRVMIVAGPGVAGQSDVSLASGIFSRAGTLGLSATGANSVTIATNGSTRLTINSSGVSAFSGVVTIPNSTALSFLDVGAAQGFRIYTSANNGIIEQVNTADIAFLTAATERMRLTGGGNLLIGTTTDAGENLQVVGATNVSTRFSASSGNYSSGISLISGAGGGSGDHAYLTMAKLGAATSGWVVAGVWNGSDNLQIVNPSDYAAKLTLFKSTNNLVLGATTDGNYRLDVGSSGSSGTLRVYDQTATTGVTQLVVRAGAGQGATSLINVQTVAGVVVSSWIPSGLYLGTTTNPMDFLITQSGGQTFLVSGGSVFTSAGLKYVWSSTSNATGMPDLGLARATTGVVEVNNGTAGTYRDLLSRSVIGTATAAATLANSQFTFHLASNTEFVITAKGSDGTTRTATVALA